LVTKAALGAAILAALLVTGGYYLQYRHPADTLPSAQSAAVQASKEYGAASDADAIAAGEADAAKSAFQAQQKAQRPVDRPSPKEEKGSRLVLLIEPETFATGISAVGR
jgi:hypothetical protein